LTIRATYSGDGTYEGSFKNGNSVTPAKENTLLVFTPPPLTGQDTLVVFIKDPSGGINLEGAGGTVTFKKGGVTTLCSIQSLSVDPNLVYTSTSYWSGGEVSCLKSISYSAGDTITVTYSGDSNYNSSSTQGKIGAVAQTVTWNTTSASYSQSGLNISAYSTTNGDGSLTYDISDIGTANCSISGTTLSWTAAGTCDISSIASGTSTWNASSPTISTFTISKSNQIKQSLLDR
jgi:hypothetical protein